MTSQEPALPVPSQSAQRQKGLATRQRVLEAAVELFADMPFDYVQVEAIAERAGVAHGLMFHHFGTKRGIYLEAVHEISHRLFKLRLPDPNLPPYSQIRQLLLDHFQHMADNETLLLGYMRGSNAMTSDPEAWTVLDRHRVEMERWALELVGLDPDSKPLRLLIRAAASGMDHLCVRWLQGGRREKIEELVEATVELVIGGLRAATKFDPKLDVETGIRLLSESGAGSARTKRGASATVKRKRAKAGKGGQRRAKSG